jgi:hypothetical protein
LTPRMMSMSSLRPLMRSSRQMCAAAGAGLGDDAGNVTGPVTDQGDAFLGDGGDHQLPRLAEAAGTAPLSGSMISGMKWSSQICRPCWALDALDGHAGTKNFRQAVDVDGLDVEFFLDFPVRI